MGTPIGDYSVRQTPSDDRTGRTRADDLISCQGRRHSNGPHSNAYSFRKVVTNVDLTELFA